MCNHLWSLCQCICLLIWAERSIFSTFHLWEWFSIRALYLYFFILCWIIIVTRIIIRNMIKLNMCCVKLVMSKLSWQSLCMKNVNAFVRMKSLNISDKLIFLTSAWKYFKKIILHRDDQRLERRCSSIKHELNSLKLCCW